MAEIPLPLLDAHILGGLRLEAVLPVLVRVEVADILDVRVRELDDLEDDVEFFRLPVRSLWRKEERLMWF